MFYNANKATESQPIESYASLLPYPHLQENSSGMFSTLSESEAREVMSIWNALPFDCQVTLEKHKNTIIGICEYF